MSPTLHKALTHGADIAAYFNHPLGIFAQENLEKSHQNVKRSKDNFSRKMSIESSSSSDIMTRCCAESDLNISKYIDL